MTHPFADAPEVLDFARQELANYYLAVTGVALENSRFGPWVCQRDRALDASLDEWAVRVSADGVQIAGAHHRAILYGVYAVCTQVLGICFVRPGYEVVPSLAEETLSLSSFGKKAAFPVRGYTVDRPVSCSEALDILAKLGYNTFALSAAYWEAHKDDMLPLMRCRGIEPAISGHDLPFFLPEEWYFAVHPDWYSLYEGERIPQQFCFSSVALRQELARVLAAYCRREGVRELTLMFNDNAFQCQCQSCRRDGFMATYLQFTQALQQYLQEQGLDVRLYHIAYNAALAWNMLEEIPASAQNHCMIACWGRDYRYALSASADDWSQRFHDAFERWGIHTRRQQKKMAVFEYYGDHWMMSSLLPPLPGVIRQDMQYMHGLGVHRVDVLHYSFQGSVDTILEVLGRPLSTAVHEVNTEGQITWLNLYLAGVRLWDPQPEDETLLHVMAQRRFGTAAAAVVDFWMGAEEALTPLTRFAGDMFKLRATDAWHRDDFSLHSTRRTNVHAWKPQADDPLTHRALDACVQAEIPLSALVDRLEEAAGKATSLSAGQQEDLSDLLRCGRYLRDKVRSLSYQYRAQIALEGEDHRQAAACLRMACKQEKQYNGLLLSDCERWLREIEALRDLVTRDKEKAT